MQIDRPAFFQRAKATVFHGIMEQAQVDGINDLLAAFDAEAVGDPRSVAYMLATTYHETARTMQPIEEEGRGRHHTYGVPDHTGNTYYGRGYVQLTWRHNYEAMSPVVGVNLVLNPGLALKPDIAARIMIYGMRHGTFTGKCLADYITPHATDFLGARRIINGQDCAAEIAGYARSFLAAIGTAP